ncbi:hypothetical protein ACJLW5_001924 [Enterobacter hormaechei]|uniref:hypothetical protein n=1 Tax=Enterobacter cloacae complex TaxID=354276 RepID=UPI0013D1D3B6|nr:hypothetical protein [Enterobacter hormaechei]HCM9433971.1 hypothetical protein [Enterobacter hormaechei subsp. steigerwaltii]EHF4967254.1 hypothetical protein [Enterobacter hormaechei]EMA2157232.1 hypothetical protein [Enterobacter hormaechei]MCM7623106.1 hypothetical protein [Enterobacter hormaechei]MCM7848582.1 hypothetical protein [Enterobacter hormaechei]
MSGENGSYNTDVFVFISQLLEEFDGKSLPVNEAERLLYRAGYVDGVRRIIDLMEEKSPEVLAEIIESFSDGCNNEPKEAIVIGNTIDNRSFEERSRIDLTKGR